MREASAVASMCALACVGVALCLLAYSDRSPTELLTGSQSLYYSDAGLSYSEREAIHKSKELAVRVARGEKRDPTIVDRLMRDIKKEKNHLAAEWEFGIAPKLMAATMTHHTHKKHHGAAQKSGLQQLRVIMTECVKCVSECPAYVHQPFSTATFDDFQDKAKAECPMCYHAVEGPCPASRNNHGVTEKQRKLTLLHALKKTNPAPAPAPAPAARHKAQHQQWSAAMGTNSVFLGKTYTVRAERRQVEEAANKAMSYGVET